MSCSGIGANMSYNSYVKVAVNSTSDGTEYWRELWTSNLGLHILQGLNLIKFPEILLSCFPSHCYDRQIHICHQKGSPLTHTFRQCCLWLLSPWICVKVSWLPTWVMEAVLYFGEQESERRIQEGDMRTYTPSDLLRLASVFLPSTALNNVIILWII